MKEEYKNRITDFVTATETKVHLIERMLDGTVPPDQNDAKRYVREILHHLNNVKEMVSIS